MNAIHHPQIKKATAGFLLAEVIIVSVITLIAAGALTQVLLWAMQIGKDARGEWDPFVGRVRLELGTPNTCLSVMKRPNALAALPQKPFTGSVATQYLDDAGERQVWIQHNPAKQIVVPTGSDGSKGSPFAVTHFKFFEIHSGENNDYIAELHLKGNRRNGMPNPTRPIMIRISVPNATSATAVDRVPTSCVAIEPERKIADLQGNCAPGQIMVGVDTTSGGGGVFCEPQIPCETGQSITRGTIVTDGIEVDSWMCTNETPTNTDTDTKFIMLCDRECL